MGEWILGTLKKKMSITGEKEEDLRERKLEQVAV